MKKVTIISAFFFASISSFAQSKEKKDTAIQITVSIDQYRGLLYAIDQNIDSKKVSKEIIEFIVKSAKMMEGDKPKELPAKEKPKQ